MLNDRELIAEFVTESQEHLAEVENQLLAMESQGQNIDVGLVNEVFRTVHSVKGAAGFLGLSTVGRLAHEMESVLNRLRNLELVPNEEITNILLSAADRLRSLLNNVECSNEQDITGHIDALSRIVEGLLNEEAPFVPAPAIDVEPISQEEPPGRDEAISDSIPPSSPATNSHEGGAAPHYHEHTGKTAASAPTGSPADANIRVSVTVLDRLMNLAGELVLSRNQLLQMVHTNATQGKGKLGDVAGRLDQVTSDLQETIMRARMQEIGTVFNRFPRIVRDLSSLLGKQCDLRLQGTEVELDKSIIEAIGDPLTHLIRNAVDHGLERPEDRLRTGKTAPASITLSAFHRAGKVHISIADNGRGIDVAKLRQKAVSQGIISAAEAQEMSDREAIRLIFRAGFSTAEKVSDVSGRGVGMDVVKTNIERLGGSVGVETELGVGTTINVTLPLTLAIVPALVVRCAGQKFAIPQASISELVRVKASETQSRIQRVKNAELLRLRNDLLPLVRLQTALTLAADATSAGTGLRSRATQIIVVETGQLRYGIVVDGLHESEEIVVKPLGRHMQDVRCLAGATILGDGRVAMILDITGLAAYCHLAHPDDKNVHQRTTGDTGTARETHSVLLFANAPDEWFAVPMDLIGRVERIRRESIEYIGHRMVMQYRGGTLPLLALEQHVTAQQRPDAPQCFVAIYRVQQREIGLIVPELVDIRTVATELDSTTLVEPGIIGSMVIDNRTTRLLDVYELTKMSRPDWFQDPPQTYTEASRPVVLLAEDSDFFRRQLESYLTAENLDVVACVDGEQAWNELSADPSRFHLVVTDIEMPHVDGLELARRIRGDAHTAHLPVIAVSSLAGEEQIEQGKSAGVNEYLIKLDRDQLVGIIDTYIHSTLATSR